MTSTASRPVALFDTNVLIYASDANSPQHAQSKALRDSVEAGRLVGAVTLQVLLEFFSLITSPRVASPRTSEQAMAEIGVLASIFEVLHQPSDLTDRVRSLGATISIRGPEIFDLAIAATALASGVTAVYTFDDGVFGRVPGLTVLTP